MLMALIRVDLSGDFQNIELHNDSFSFLIKRVLASVACVVSVKISYERSKCSQRDIALSCPGKQRLCAEDYHLFFV